MNELNTLDRRKLMASAAGLMLPTWLCACESMKTKTEFDSKINQKVHWARRQNWTGNEYVFGVAGLGDRYLMVKKRNSGWDFPGGQVIASMHGQKTSANEDLVFAAASFVNSQALISQRLGESVLFAYGFAINPMTRENSMVHWFNIAVPSTFASNPHPNLTETIDAKWVTLDDPVLGRCLKMRINEYSDAAEGGSILKESCFEYST